MDETVIEACTKSRLVERATNQPSSPLHVDDANSKPQGRKEGFGLYVAFNSLGLIAMRQKPGTRKKFPSLHA